MKYPIRILVLLVTSLLISHSFGQVERDSREQREIKTAEYLLLSALAQSISPVVRKKCFELGAICTRNESAETSVALVGSRGTTSSSDALVNLMRFDFDAGLAEDYSCYIVQKGTPIERKLKAISPVKLSEQCIGEVSAFLRRTADVYGDVDTSKLCRSASRIDAYKKELIEAVRAKRKCTNW